MENINECLLVGVDFTRGKDKGVLIVGRSPHDKPTEIINAFQGEEAYELYKKLITKISKGDN